ncbi:MAG: sugar ABC transporter permease [Spirochaetales bacterium]|nr:MAG: sugar ABC transporter permease [Spirochaetales bacterium]
MWSIVVFIFPYAITFTVPLLITSLGGLICERSGVVNIGLEGLMIIGSFASALFIYWLYPVIGHSSVWLGLLIAMLAGALFSLLHAFASINLNANQVISGTAINMIAGALTVFFARFITGSGNIRIMSGLRRYDVPVFSRIPVLGKLLFTQTYTTTWIVLLFLLGAWYMVYKTPFGLRLRSCGEHPQAADAAGVNVRKIRYVGVLFSGAFAGLGGALILVTYSGEFNGTVSGLGFLALASLIFGQWKPLGILGATFFFGFASTLANVSQVVPALASVPALILKAFPYVLTLIALVFFSKSSQAPRAAGEPFDQAKR